MSHRLIITVHGISTFGGWQERLENVLCGGGVRNDYTIVNYKFGYFSVLAFLIPFFRWLTVLRFRHFLLGLARDNAYSRIDIVAHSFGTHIAAWALYGIPIEKRPPINTLLFAGSVLKSSFPWDAMIGHGIRRVINDCGISDNVLLLNQITVLFTGMAGRIGFNGGISRTLRNRYFDFGHSGYFVIDNRPDDAFMRRYWIPLLTSDADPELVDTRTKGALGGIKLMLLSNSEPIKLAVYVSPFAAVAFLFFSLYGIAERQREEAERQRHEADRQSTIAIESKDRADAARNEALLAQSKFLTDIARGEIDQGSPTTALLLALEALPDETSTDDSVRSRPYWNPALLSLDAAVRASREALVLRGHESVITSVAVTPDGTRIVSGSWDNTTRIWDAETGRPLAILRGHTDRILCVVVTPDGRQIATGSQDKTVRLWDVQSGRQLGLLRGHNGNITSLAATPDSARIVSGSDDKTVRIWDAQTGQQLGVISQDFSVEAVAVTPDGSRIVTGVVSSPKMWNAETFDEISSFNSLGRDPDEFHLGGISSLAMTADGSRIVTASQDGTARVWDAQTGAHLAKLGPRDGAIMSVAVTPDGNRIITGSGHRFKNGQRSIRTTPQDNRMRIWDARTGTELNVFKPADGTVLAVSATPDGTRIVFGLEDYTVRIWRLQNQNPTIILDGKIDKIRNAAVTPDGSRIVSSADDNTIHVWDIETQSKQMELKGSNRGITSAISTPDRNRIITGSHDGTARVWDIRTGAELLTLKGRDWLTSLAVTPDGTRIVAGFGYWSGLNFSTDRSSRERVARIWDAATGVELGVLNGHSAGIRSVVVTPDGHSVVTGSIDGTVRIWDAATGAQRLVIRASESQVASLAITPDGERIITGSFDGSARIWDARTGSQILALNLGASWVTSVTTTPDGTRIITGSADGVARVWDAGTGAKLAELVGEGAVSGMAVTPDGSRLVTISDQGVVRVWELLSRDRSLISQARLQAPRCLTPSERQRFFLTPKPPAWCRTMHKWPYDVGSAFLEAVRSLVLGNDADAEIYFAELLSSDASSGTQIDVAWATAYINRAGQLADAGKDKEANEVFDRALRLIPSVAGVVDARRTNAYIARARSLQKQGEYNEARALFGLALARDSSAGKRIEEAWATASIERADDIRREGPIEEVRELLTDAVRRNPSHSTLAKAADVYNDVAWTAFLQGNAVNSLHDAEKAAALSPGNGNILDTRGQIYWVFGRFKEACADLAKAATLGVKSAGTYYRLGQCYELDGNRELAISTYLRALDQYAHDDYSRSAQENAKSQLQRLTEAEAKP